jgi:signal transduction histidine kinase/ligand-binding sensor protein/CheY-like chemotaxis protein
MKRIMATQTIGKRITLGFSVLILLFLGGIITIELAGIPGTNIQGKLVGNRNKHLTQLELASGMLSERISSWFAERRIDVHGLAISPLFRTAIANKTTILNPDIAKELQAFLASHPDLDSIAVLKPADSTILAASGTFRNARSAADIGVNAETFARFIAPGSQEMIEINLHHDNRLRLRIVRQMLSPNPSQPITALLVAESDIEKSLRPLIWSIRNSMVSSEWTCVIASSVGTNISQFLVNGNGIKTLNTPLSSISKSVPITLALEGVNGTYEGFDQFGNNVLAFHRKINVDRGTSLGLVLKIDTAIAFKPLKEDLIQQTFLWLSLLVVGFILCTLLARQIVQPLKELAAVARKIAGGDLTVRAAVNDVTEIGQLAVVFNGMVAKIEYAHLELEAQVENRTHDLQAATEKLQAQNEELQLNEEEMRCQNDELMAIEVMLRASEEQYRLLVSNLTSGIVVHAPDSSVLFANSMALAMLGLSKEQLKDKTAIDPSWTFLRETGTAMRNEEYPVNQVLTSGAPLSDFIIGVHHPNNSAPVWMLCNAYPVTTSEGDLQQVVVIFSDITKRKLAEDAHNKRLIALTQPLENTTIAFEELFNIDDLQQLQDEFAKATGVASIITRPDGTPLTTPSNFTRLCNDIIRKTEKGCASCYKSDATLGRFNPDGPTIQICLSGGLWNAGASIMVGGTHIANWLIGQVRNESQTEESMAAYAREIGVDEVTFLEAFRDVTAMSKEKFEQIAQTLYTLTKQLSLTAYQNIQQARFINERNNAEAALRTSETTYRSLSNELQVILNTSPIGICLLKDRKVIRANSAFDSMFGYEIGSTLAMDTVSFYANDELYEATGSNGYQALVDGCSYSTDVLMKKLDTTLLWCNITGHAINPHDLTEGSIWILQDISERKQSEIQMNNLSQRLQLATSAAHLGVWDWNVRDNSMIWDDRMFELYGITRDISPNNIGAWMNGLHPDDKDTAIIECQAALNGEKEFDSTFRILHPDGAVKYIKANGLVLRGADGTPERMIGINVDITDTKRAEAEKNKLELQLQQAQKMESVGRLAGGVAHDFNNMLSVIIGHAELGLMRLEPTHPVCGDLQVISKTAERSADLTRQLLAFARKQTVMPRVIDLNETVTSMFKMLQRLIGEDIHLTWQPSSDLCQIKIDPSQIDQILANLCVNARDAIEGTGRITIETTTCTIDSDYCTTNPEATPGTYVRLTVSDNGKGMAREVLTHIFEPFYTTKELGKGTGLGLATVYGAIKQNNGFINIYSEPGTGTTFSLYLPRYEEQHIHKETDSSPLPVPRGMETILLVEDEAAILNITAIMLEKQGYSVLRAETPGRAIELAQEHPGTIHLLMTDVIMPEMNGRDLAKKILSIHPGMKRLFMSGYTADVIAHHGVLDEGVHFIQKPFSLPNMATMVREVLDTI